MFNSSTDMKRAVLKNSRGIGPTTSHLLLLAVTVLAMILVINSSQTIIAARHDQMGERAFVENVFFTPTQVTIYIRNVGHADITLKEAQINNKVYDIDDVVIPLPENDPSYSIYSITIPDTFEHGIYLIRFISGHNNFVGITEVEFA
jgi:hypothetical protein